MALSVTSNLVFVCNATFRCTRGTTRATMQPSIPILCNTGVVDNQLLIKRRSGNFKPTRWDFDYIQSIHNEFLSGEHMERATELQDKVKILLNNEETSNLEKMELVDTLQKLGISHLFEEEIRRILQYVHESKHCKNYGTMERDLYSTSIEFRLLRQHGFHISPEGFDAFIMENGEFDPLLCLDEKGLLELYEASFLSYEGEKTMDLARELASASLRTYLQNHRSEHDDIRIRYAMEMPLHWRAENPKARWFIDFYNNKIGGHENSVVLELAKLNFNIVQAHYQQELKHVSRWLNQRGFAKKLSFARDGVVDSYIFSIGTVPPGYEFLRIMNAKIFIIGTIIDDVFDVYGTFEELTLFNNAMLSWDINDINKLPDYMRILFDEVDLFIKEMEERVSSKKGITITPFLRKSLSELCKAYIQEAEWYRSGNMPTLEEYINNAWRSVGIFILLSNIFFLMENSITLDGIETLYSHDIMRYTGILSRIANDLATSSDELKRGDVPKSLELYMNETGASIDDAKDHFKLVMNETWKKLNELLRDSPFPSEFIKLAFEQTRIVLHVYALGDGFGMQVGPTTKGFAQLLFDPVV